MLPKVPASLFGIVVGLSGLSMTWRAATAAWHAPAAVGEFLALASSLCWLVLISLYALKWVTAREDAIAETRHPVLCCFVGLAGVATILVAGGVLPYSRSAALLLFFGGSAFTFGFAVWRTGALWQGGRDVATSTPVLYLPTGAGSFAAVIVGSNLGYESWAQLAFGGGMLSWLAIESVLLHRLLTGPPMADALRPTLGLQLAPPAVGCAAYLSISHGPPDLFAHALIGYALLQTSVLIRLLPWIWRGASAGYWSFTFGASSLATASLKLLQRGDTDAIATLAPMLFVFANVAVLGAIFATLRQVWGGAAPPQTVAVVAER